MKFSFIICIALLSGLGTANAKDQPTCEITVKTKNGAPIAYYSSDQVRTLEDCKKYGYDAVDAFKTKSSFRDLGIKRVLVFFTDRTSAELTRTLVVINP